MQLLGKVPWVLYKERGCKFAPRTISNWPTTAVGAGILSSKLLRRSDYEW